MSHEEWVEGCWRRGSSGPIARDELRMPSDKEIQIQTLGLMCREMRVWKDMWRGGTSTESPAHLFFMDKISTETLRVQPIHVHRGLMYWPQRRYWITAKWRNKRIFNGQIDLWSEHPRQWRVRTEPLVLSASGLKEQEAALPLSHLRKRQGTTLTTCQEGPHEQLSFLNFWDRLTKCFLLSLMKLSWGKIMCQEYMALPCATVYLFAKYAICWQPDICWALSKISQRERRARV